MAYIASTDGKRPIQFREIAAALHVSRNSLAKIIQYLSRSGLLRVERGREGGCVLIRTPDQITALDVIEAVDGPIQLGDPLLDGTVRRKTGLLIVRELRGAVEEMRERLNRTTITDLAG